MCCQLRAHTSPHRHQALPAHRLPPTPAPTSRQAHVNSCMHVRMHIRTHALHSSIRAGMAVTRNRAVPLASATSCHACLSHACIRSDHREMVARLSAQSTTTPSSLAHTAAMLVFVRSRIAWPTLLCILVRIPSNCNVGDRPLEIDRTRCHFSNCCCTHTTPVCSMWRRCSGEPIAAVCVMCSRRCSVDVHEITAQVPQAAAAQGVVAAAIHRIETGG